MKTYYASPAFLYNHKGRRYERSLPIRFLAENDVEAIRAAIRFARNRAMAFDWECGSLKVAALILMPIAASGYLGSHEGVTFFEWKCDWPGTIDGHVEAFRNKGANA